MLSLNIHTGVFVPSSSRYWPVWGHTVIVRCANLSLLSTPLTKIVALGELSDTVLDKVKSATISDSDYDVRSEAINALLTLLVEQGGTWSFMRVSS